MCIRDRNTYRQAWIDDAYWAVDNNVFTERSQRFFGNAFVKFTTKFGTEDVYKRQAQNGKKVTVFVELKARFDEENNLATAEMMQAAGIKIISVSYTHLDVYKRQLL